MQAKAQRGQASRAGDRVRRLGRAAHSACRSEKALTVCPIDCVVDFGRDAEIVCGNDNPSQAGRSRRARRKWKNSTPSRKRRFIMAGLAIISARMAAIFEGRK